MSKPLPDQGTDAVGTKSPIQSIDRAVAMLGVIADAGPAGEVLTAIASATGVHASTARTLLTSLAFHGFVDQDQQSRRYRIGPAVFELERKYSAQSDLATVAAPVMRKLWEDSRETVHLAVLQGGRRVDLAVLVSPQLLNVNPTLAAQPDTSEVTSSASANSLYTTAAGKILLLTLSAEERMAHLEQIGAVVTSRGASSLEHVRAELAEVEASGLARNDEEEEPGVCGIAAPILDNAGVIRAALCIGYPSVRKSAEYDELLRRLVVDAATELSAALGAAPKRAAHGG
ncbi:IclR family transcriptional regulator [Rathayibacter sp. CAU 1779]